MSSDYVNSGLSSINSSAKAPNVFIDVSDGGGPANPGGAIVTPKIIDVTPATNPTYGLSSSVPIASNLETFTITLTTTDIPTGTDVAYTISNITSEQIDNASLTGNFSVSNNTDAFPLTLTGEPYWLSLIESAEGMVCSADSSGNLYILSSRNNGGIMKYDKFGALLWVKSYSSEYWASFRDITIDNNDNCILSGEFSLGNINVSVLSKLDSNGNVLWTKTIEDFEGVLNLYSDDVVIDSQNNIIITYDGDAKGVIKFDSTGTILWQRSISLGAAPPPSTYLNSIDSVSVDNLGNVILTVDSSLPPNNNDSITIFKFDINGNLVWQKSIIDPDNIQNLSAYDTSFDSNNNLYITGEFWGMNPQTEMYYDKAFLIKVDTNGNIVWQNMFGQGTDYTGTYSVAVDSQDNIYVGGDLFDDVESDDFCFVARFNHVDGSLVWQRVIGGPDGSYANGIATDLNDNVYVTGWYGNNQSENSYSINGKLKNNGAFTGIYDNTYGQIVYRESFATVDTTLLTAVDGPFEVATDLFRVNDNVITITSDSLLNETNVIGANLPDHLTVSLDNGQATVSVQIVEKTYTLSSDKNIAIPGETVVITLDTTGVINGTSVPFTITGVKSSDISGAPLTGNFVVNNNTAAKSYIMSPTPPNYWYSIMSEYGSPNCYFIDSVVNSNGDVIVLGERSASGVLYDTISIVKYNTAGDVLTQWEITTPTGCRAGAIAIDSTGNLFIAGLVFNVSVDYPTDTSGFILKLDSSFAIQWSKNITTSRFSSLSDITVDSTGAIYVIGNKQEVDITTTQIFISKISNSGTTIWYNALGNLPPSAQQGDGITVDAEGYTYISGSYTSDINVPESCNLFVARVDPLGNLMWQKIIPSGNSTYARRLIVNSEIYVVASYNPDNGISSAIILKLAKDGSSILSHKTFGINWTFTNGVDITQDSSGNLYVAMRTGESNGMYVLKLDSNLNDLWQKIIYTNDHIDTINGITWDSLDDTLILSCSTESIFSEAHKNYMVVKIPTDGSVNGQFGLFNIYNGSLYLLAYSTQYLESTLSILTDPITYTPYECSGIGSNYMLETYDLGSGYPTMTLTLDNGSDSVSVATRAYVPMIIGIDNSENELYTRLPFTGTYNITVNWGDGTIDNFITGQLVEHTYASNQAYGISITGNATAYGIEGNNNSMITAVNTFGDLGFISLNWAFHNATSLTDAPTEIPATVLTMSHMFDGASSFMYGCDNWDTRNVHDMSFMFKDAINFNGWLDRWNTGSVTTMAGLFNGASAFNQPINSWNVSNVTDFGLMFMNATSFNQYLENWNVGNAEGFNYMFYGSAFNQYLGSWVMPKCLYTDYMFANSQFNNDSINSWNMSNVLYTRGMFANCPFNQNISGWNTSKVIAMSEMFMGNTVFNQPIGSWDVSKVSYIAAMFAGATSFNQDLSTWNTFYANDMSNMFNGATSFIQNISGWDVSKIPTYPEFFLHSNPMDPKVTSTYDSYLPAHWGPYDPPNFA